MKKLFASIHQFILSDKIDNLRNGCSDWAAFMALGYFTCLFSVQNFDFALLVIHSQYEWAFDRGMREYYLRCSP